MKKNLALIVALVGISSLIGFSVAHAQESDTTITLPATPTLTLPQVTTENQTKLSNQTSLSKVITLGNKQITNRLASLAKLKTAITKSKLTADQQTTLTSMIDTNVNGLTQLKTKLDAETDINLAKADVTSIYADYRIYAVLTPQINSLRQLDMNTNTLAKLQNTTFVKYQTKIDSLKAKGQTALVAKMEAGLAKAKTDATTADGLISSTTTLAQNLKPADYPTKSKTTLTQIRTNLKQIHSDFQMIRTDLAVKGKIAEKTQ